LFFTNMREFRFSKESESGWGYTNAIAAADGFNLTIRIGTAITAVDVANVSAIALI